MTGTLQGAARSARDERGSRARSSTPSRSDPTQRAAESEDGGITTRSVVPVTIETADGCRTAERDEGLCRDTSLERLKALRPAFEDATLGDRYPQIR